MSENSKDTQKVGGGISFEEFKEREKNNPNSTVCLKFLHEWVSKNVCDIIGGVMLATHLSKFSIFLDENNYTIVKKENPAETNKEK